MFRSPSSTFLARFQRRTTSGDFIPWIDGLRFVAIAMVVLAHVANYSVASPPADDRLLHVLQQGGFGVEVFFVISGFILALPFAAYRLHRGRPVSLRRYYLRRVTRLEPPYVLSLLLIYGGLALFTGGAGRMLPHLLAGLGYAHSVAYGRFDTINSVAWSLEIEIQFYVLVPLLACVFLIRRGALRRLLILGLAFAAITVERYALLPASDRFGLTIFAYLQFFLMGFLLADLYLERWRSATRSRYSWDAVWLLALVAVSLLLRNGTRAGFSPAGTWVIPLLMLPLFIASLKGTLARRFLTNRWIYTVGGMCYSIYLLHFAVIRALSGNFGRVRVGSSFGLNWLIQDLLVVPIVLAVAAAFFVAVERPCMNPRWPHELAVRVRRRTEAPAGELPAEAPASVPV